MPIAESEKVHPKPSAQLSLAAVAEHGDRLNGFPVGRHVASEKDRQVNNSIGATDATVSNDNVSSAADRATNPGTVRA